MENIKPLRTIIRKDGKPITLKEDKYRFFFPNEYMKFEDKLKKKQKHSVKVLINTGARINEARNVRVNDIDFDNKRIVLRVTKAKAKAGEEKGRGRMRTIPISTQFSKYLKKYCNENKLNNEDYINVQSTPAMNIGMKKAAALAGLKNPRDFSPHNLRKTLECWLMALGVDGLILVAHFGHDFKTAAQHYVSPDIFSYEEKQRMRMIIGDLYAR